MEVGKKFSENIIYKGCFPDFAFDHPEFQRKKYYNETLGLEGRDILLPLEIRDTASLPNRKKTHFNRYKDGPARYMPSIDHILDPKDLPEHLDQKQAVSRCYEKAKFYGHKYFGLQSNGVCMGSSDPKVMTRQLSPEKCQVKGEKERGKGGDFTNSIYEIQDLEAPHNKQPVDEDEQFRAHTYDTPSIGDKMDCKSKEFFDLSPSQLYTQTRFTPQNPIKGIILLKSAGSGKTCEGLNAAGNFFEAPSPGKTRWIIYWVTRKTLRGIPTKELFKNICLTKLRDIINSPDQNIEYSTGKILAEKGDRVKKIKVIQDGTAYPLLKRQYGIELPKNRILSYDNFVRLISRDTKAFGEQYDRALERGDEKKRVDFGYKSLFIFDEAHNLQVKSLPVEERQVLDKVFKSGVTISGETFTTKSQIYGTEASNDDDFFEGRDLIAAMLYRSYKLSGPNSAKVMLLTATPTTNLLWMINLLQTHPANRISTNATDYYNEGNSLKDHMVQKFVKAAYGTISYLNTTNNPSKFSRKVFAGVRRSVMLPFHSKLLQQRSKDIRAKYPGDTTKLIALYRNLSVFAQTKGAVYSHAQIQTYESLLDNLDVWDEKKERRRQTELYQKDLEKARKAFKLQVRKVDRQLYAKKRKLFQAWEKTTHVRQQELSEWLHRQNLRSTGNKPDSTPLVKPPLPIGLWDVMGENQQIISFERWRHAGPEFVASDELDTPGTEALKLEYNTKLEMHRKNQRLLREYVEFNMTLLPRKIDVGDILNRFGIERTFQDFKNLRAARIRYDSLVDLAKGPLGEKKSVPEPHKLFREVVDKQGKLRSFDSWYWSNAETYKKRHFKPKVKYNTTQRLYLKFIIRDAHTQRMRLKTLEEFVVVTKPEVPEFEGPPQDAKFKFILHHKGFSRKRMREILPYYAPKIVDLIENIIRIEASMRAKTGRGTKHTVFTFSSSQKKPQDFRNYGSRILLSAFAAYPQFRIMVQFASVGHYERKLVNNNTRGDQWGVTTLSSGTLSAKNIVGNTASRPQTVDYATPAISEATQTAFNSEKNAYGDIIKILILDGAFVEGVEGHDVGVTHFLNPGGSKDELKQAVARSSRNCKSTH
jgi:hypothetical protein